MSELKVVVIAAFGKFAVEIDGEVQLFETEATALAAGTLSMNGAAYRGLAANYCAGLELSEKQTKMQTNIIVSFLAWQDSSTEEEVAAKADAVKEDEDF